MAAAGTNPADTDKFEQIPILDYDNFEFDSKETTEYIAKLREELESTQQAQQQRNPFGFPHAFPSVTGGATEEALSFLANIKAEWILELLCEQSLDVYEDDKAVGQYTLSIDRVPNDTQQHIFRVVTRYITDSGGVQIKEVHDGTITEKLETISQKHSFSKSGLPVSLDQTSHIEIDSNGSYSITILNGKNEMVSSWSTVHAKEELKGFVSESAHILLSRLFASDENLPENFAVLAMDSLGHFRKVQYETVHSHMITFRPYKVECFGFKRDFPQRKGPNSIQTTEYFLNRQLVYQDDSELGTVIKATTVPTWSPTHFMKQTELQVKPSQQMEENWLISLRRAELQALFQKKFANTLGKYPQLTQPLKEMTRLILTVRPDDVFAFVTQSFRKWKDIYAEPQLLNSNGMILALDHKDRQPEPQGTICPLLRAYGVNNDHRAN